MTVRYPVPLLALLTLLACAPISSVSADHGDGHSERTITVSGSGETAVRPDTASISTGVVSEAQDAKTAVRVNSESVGNLFAALKKAGVRDDDMQTSAFNVAPVYGRPQPGTPPKIDGYRTTNTVAVRVRDLKILGGLLDRMISAGANQLNGVRFYIDDPEPHFDKARQRAVADARRKAEIYAQAAGVHLGRVIAISESSAAVPSPVFRNLARSTARESVPVASGEQTLQVTITVTYELR